jgi:hypothetical protein
MIEKEKIIRTTKLMVYIKQRLISGKEIEFSEPLYSEVIKVMPHWGFNENEIKQIKCNS